MSLVFINSKGDRSILPLKNISSETFFIKMRRPNRQQPDNMILTTIQYNRDQGKSYINLTYGPFGWVENGKD